MPAQPSAGEPSPPSSDPSWEGDRMFNIYIYDYCNKRGFRKTARELLVEAEIPPDSAPPINARQGLLFEWWSVFWVLFTAKSNGTGTDDAMVYTHHQMQQQHLRQHNAPQMRQAPPAMNRFMNGTQRPQASMPPNGQMPNGVGPASLPGNPGPIQNGAQGPMAFPMNGPQTNGIPMSSGGPPGQPGSFSQLLPGQQRPGGPPRPNGAAPPFQSPTMSHSPHITGGNPGSGPQHSQSMNQLVGPPGHLTNLNRPMHPSNPSLGSAPQTQTPPFPMGRSPSRPGTPGQGGMMQRSPSLVARQTPSNDPNLGMLNQELSRLPTEAVTAVKAAMGFGDKELHSLSFQDKQRIMNEVRQRSVKASQLGPVPSNLQGMAPPGQQRRPVQHPTMQQPPQQQQQQQQHQQQQHQQQQQHAQRTIKRNSTSPGEEHGTLPNSENSPPDRKRQRRTPPPMEQTSSMGPGPGYPHPQQQGMPGGPQQMPNGNMMRPMQGAPMNNFQPHGVPPNMGNPGMGLPMGAPGNAMSPGMVPGPGHNMMMTNAAMQYRQSMTATTKTLLAAAAPGASEQGFHPVQGQQQFVGSQNNRIGQNLAQAKPMGGMAPPASPAIGGPMKDQKDVKPMINNPSGMPEGSPHNAPAAPGQGGPSSNPTGSAHGTAPPTPNTINSSITQSPAPNGTPSVPPASNPASQPQPNLSDLPPNFMSSDFMQSMSALEDLDPSMFRTDFEQDFREWFDPGGVDHLK
ncbi:uncharacterized protein HD556DRAFT_1246775 [Suillus plorans]|uniref:LisH domain-containing protein n=1 Tax=Suillus plorans TaxID=116603 RepID=A0A9P7AE73_9AGAM|nr:uncharacterized protein HD556DRAFT_1246775 [Suillus plorans]KAG1787495.1 hypothetical protein HD556DRAFT_1246775 [Suillus plorans]